MQIVVDRNPSSFWYDTRLSHFLIFHLCPRAENVALITKSPTVDGLVYTKGMLV